MYKFKVGDKVKCIESISEWDGGPTKGQIYTIVSINNDISNGIGIHLPLLNSKIYEEVTRLGKIPNWGRSCFELVEEYKQPVQKNERDKGWGFE